MEVNNRFHAPVKPPGIEWVNGCMGSTVDLDVINPFRNRLAAIRPVLSHRVIRLITVQNAIAVREVYVLENPAVCEVKTLF